MYVGKNIYVKNVESVNLDDRTFFIECLNLAKDVALIDSSLDKTRVPVVFCSSLSKASTDELISVPRKSVHDKARARRKFLMIDADFESGQEDESESLIEKIKCFGEKFQTPVMIYPTPSFPDKPRFRAVFLVKRVLNEKSYEKAMRWLYSELECEILDDFDLRIGSNRNLPAFKTIEQAQASYSTFDNEELSPLDNSLWKNVELPKKASFVRAEAELDIDFVFDSEEIIKGARLMSKSAIAKTYSTFWVIVDSIAAAVLDERLDDSTARKMLEELAHSDESKFEFYKSGNIHLYEKSLERMMNDDSVKMKSRPLEFYSEFVKAIRLD